ncbi:MAG: outer membrane protein assembly factor BamD [Gammaproteobacteria bacterium]|nr:outer membrane protein assembly factor BamD [Gammaproteobacteria bacterium]
MKNDKWIILVFVLFYLAGCAAPPTGSEAYKGKPPQEIFVKGERSLSKKHFKEAVAEFEAFDALYPFDPRAEQTQVDLIYAYYKAGDPDSAIAASDRYIRLYPMSPKIAYVYYLRGVVNMDRNISWIYNAFPCDPAKRDLASLSHAFVDFQRLLQLYPSCIYAADAQKRMVHIKNLLARHELQIAEFYFNRHAYVAAANRASYIVQHLPGTPQVPTALVIMVKSYRALGDDELANDALEVLKVNYPNETKRL